MTFSTFAFRCLMPLAGLSVTLNAQEPTPQNHLSAHPIAAQKLVQEIVLWHPDLNNCTIHAKTPEGMAIIASGVDMRMVGRKSGADDLQVLTSGQPATEMETEFHQFEVLLPLKDQNGRAIGVLATVFKEVPIYEKDDYIRKALQIQSELQRLVPTEGDLFKRL